MTNFAILNTVSVVQLVERQIVVLVVVGSSPTVHPPLRSCIARSLFYSISAQKHEPLSFSLKAEIASNFGLCYKLIYICEAIFKCEGG